MRFCRSLSTLSGNFSAKKSYTLTIPLPLITRSAETPPKRFCGGQQLGLCRVARREGYVAAFEGHARTPDGRSVASPKPVPAPTQAIGAPGDG